MFKTIFNKFIDHPLLTSLFLTDLLILLFHRPPLVFSLVMFSALIALSMYFGQKMAIFK